MCFGRMEYKMIESALIENIRKEQESPLIGVIGSTAPNCVYEQMDGIRIGTLLRKFIRDHKGTLFTGGVDGVGVDVYTGIIKFCYEEGMKKRVMLDDKFFVIVPEHEDFFQWTGEPGFHGEEHIAHIIPATYHALGALSKKGTVNVIRAGEDMATRRQYIGLVADVLVAVNGSRGTLDEAYQCLKASHPVITLPSSGGTAAFLERMKTKQLENNELAYLAKQRMSVDDFNTDLIYVAKSIDELPTLLRTLV